jgi:integrase
MIEVAVLAYLQHHEGVLKNHRDTVGALRLLQPWYAGKDVTELPAICQAFSKVPDLSPGTKRNRLAYLRAACRWAWKHIDGFCDHDPAERVSLPRANNARHVYPTRADCVRIFRAMGYGYSRDAARVAFYTGWRIGEVLRAKAVRTQGGWTLQISDSKNGMPRIVPVHHRISYLVRGHWPPKVTKWTVSKHVKAAMQAVGLGHARLHDLRHGAASEMINAGVDLYTVGGVLGHKSAVSTARYAHLAHHRLREAVEKIGGRNPHTRGP